MSKIQLSCNLQKHTSKNPLQKLLIGNFYTTLLSAVKPLKINNILDAGCGEGFSLERLQKSDIGKEYTGIDFSKDAITVGKKLFPNFDLKQASIYSLPYKDNSFDIVLCTEVLEHLEDPKKGYKEIVRVSKKYILVSVPNEPIFMLSNLLRGKNIKRLGNDIEHINHWNFISFQKFLLQENVKILKIRLPFPWQMFLLEKK